MASVADQIAKLTEPVPQVVDAEDDLNFESNAKLSERQLVNSDEEILYSSNLRRKTDPLLHEIDSKYAGQRISRKSLEDIDGDSDSSAAELSGDEENSDDDDNEEDNDFSADEADIEAFKKIFSSEQRIREDTAKDDCENDSENALEVSSSNENQREDAEMSTESESEENSEDDMIQQFSQVNVVSEIEKGKAVQSQLELWYKLCECRIKLQKLLLVANKLPQCQKWSEFKEKSDDSYKTDIKKAERFVRCLLKDCIDFQMQLLKYNMKVIDGESEKGADNSEEILSDECSGSDVDTGKKVENPSPDITLQLVAKKSFKRKHSYDDYDEILSKRHKSLVPYRNSVIQNWDQKTRLTTGRITEKSFGMFNQTAIDQINQILLDKERLIKRTQVKRADYQVLGKVENDDPEEKAIAEGENAVEIKRPSVVDHDPEIFDDEDFYRQLLKDVIDCKSVGIDPVVLSKQLEIQRVRSKIKRKVDTKASKGRKIRYDVHPKLVNFMAPVINASMSSEAKDELFMSLFGQRRKVSEGT